MARWRCCQSQQASSARRRKTAHESHANIPTGAVTLWLKAFLSEHETERRRKKEWNKTRTRWCVQDLPHWEAALQGNESPGELSVWINNRLFILDTTWIYSGEQRTAFMTFLRTAFTGSWLQGRLGGEWTREKVETIEWSHRLKIFAKSSCPSLRNRALSLRYQKNIKKIERLNMYLWELATPLVGKCTRTKCVEKNNWHSFLIY